MIEYEVSLIVDEKIKEKFLVWLKEHVGQMLGIDGFQSAQILEDTASQAPSYCVRYQLKSKEDLDRYLQQDAQRMRQDGLDRFGGAFSASRKILKPLGA